MDITHHLGMMKAKTQAVYYFREITSNLPEKFEGMFIGINIQKKKCLVYTGYNPKIKYIQTFLEQVSKSLNELIKEFENINMLGDFNAQIMNTTMKDFCESYGLNHLMTEPTCFENAPNPTCIDMIMTNSPKSFENSLYIETVLKGRHRKDMKIMYRYRVLQQGLKGELENSERAKEDY